MTAVAPGRARLAPEHVLGSRASLPFVVGSASFIHIDVLGQIYIIEVILAYVLILRGASAIRTRRITIEMGLLPKWWIVIVYAILLTQLYMSSTVVAIGKASLLYVFLISNVFGLQLLLENKRERILQLCWGVIAGSVFQFCLQPTTFERDLPWKFGFAFPALLLGGLLATRTQRDWLRPLIFSTLTVLNLALNTRSLAGLSFACCVVIMLFGVRSEKARFASRAVLLPGLLILGLVGWLTYSNLAMTGRLGSEVENKYEMQSQGQFGILLGGRPELFYTAAAIIKDPIVGRGYAPPLENDVADASREGMRRLGYIKLISTAAVDGLIPMHSYLLGAWVMFGIVGAAFWVVVARRILKNWWTLLQNHDNAAPLASVLIIVFLWNLLFSPFGADARFAASLAIVVLAGLARSTTIEE